MSDASLFSSMAGVLSMFDAVLCVVLLVVVLVMRARTRDEVARSHRAIGHSEGRLKEAITAVDKEVNEALQRLREAELGIAGIKPQLENLTDRVNEIHDAIRECATREDMRRLLSRIEALNEAKKHGN